jgi:hypothetical protein
LITSARCRAVSLATAKNMIATTRGNDQARESRRLRTEDTWSSTGVCAAEGTGAEFSRLIPQQSKGTPAAINIGARDQVESVIGVVAAGFSYRSLSRPTEISI